MSNNWNEIQILNLESTKQSYNFCVLPNLELPSHAVYLSGLVPPFLITA